MSGHARKAMDRAAMAAVVSDAMAELEGEAKLAELIAATRKIHYDAYLAKGFNADQALTLCMKRSMD
jgi:hypothetical protein